MCTNVLKPYCAIQPPISNRNKSCAPLTFHSWLGLLMADSEKSLNVSATRMRTDAVDNAKAYAVRILTAVPYARTSVELWMNSVAS
jgi:hypothetical protein